MIIENNKGSYIERVYKYNVLKGTEDVYVGEIKPEDKDKYEEKTKTICYVTLADGTRHKYTKGEVTSLAINSALRTVKTGQINDKTSEMIEDASMSFKCADGVTRRFSLKRENQQNGTALMTVLNESNISNGLIEFEIQNTNEMYKFVSVAEFTQWYNLACGIVSAMYTSGKILKKQLESVTADIINHNDTRDASQIITVTKTALESLSGPTLAPATMPTLDGLNGFNTGVATPSAPAIKITETDYTIENGIDVVLCKAKPLTITLPVPVNTGRKLTIMNHFANTGNVTINGFSVDGAAPGIFIQPINKLNLIAIDGQWLSI